MSDDGETAPGKHRALKAPWEPGKSGNPLGRPKGSRNKLGEAFIQAMHEDFMQYGPAVIEAVRTDKPDQYLKVIASILPKELHIKEESLDDLPDNELVDILTTLRSLTGTGRHKKAGKGTGETSH